MSWVRLFFCASGFYALGAGDWRGTAGAAFVWLVVELCRLDYRRREERARRAWERARRLSYREP